MSAGPWIVLHVEALADGPHDLHPAPANPARAGLRATGSTGLASDTDTDNYTRTTPASMRSSIHAGGGAYLSALRATPCAADPVRFSAGCPVRTAVPDWTAILIPAVDL